MLRIEKKKVGGLCVFGQRQHKLPDANNDFVSLLYMLVYSIINKTCRTCTMLWGNERPSNHSIEEYWSIGYSAVLVLLLYNTEKWTTHTHTHTRSMWRKQSFEIFDDEITVAHSPYIHIHVFIEDKTKK